MSFAIAKFLDVSPRSLSSRVAFESAASRDSDKKIQSGFVFFRTTKPLVIRISEDYVVSSSPADITTAYISQLRCLNKWRDGAIGVNFLHSCSSQLGLGRPIRS